MGGGDSFAAEQLCPPTPFLKPGKGAARMEVSFFPEAKHGATSFSTLYQLQLLPSSLKAKSEGRGEMVTQPKKTSPPLIFQLLGKLDPPVGSAKAHIAHIYR